MFNFSKLTLSVPLIVLFITAGLVGGPANGPEASLMRCLAEFRPDWPMVTAAFAILTILGSAYATLGVTGAVSVWLLLRRAPARALMLALAVLLTRLSVDALKSWIERPRPQFELDWLPQSLAFPSGHAANSMAAFVAAALIAAPPRWRRTAVIAAVSLSIVIGLSRVYLGVHWPSDVIGGWALALLVVASAMAIGERSAVLRQEMQHEIIGRHRLPGGEDETA